MVVPLWTENMMTLCGAAVRRNWGQSHALPWVKSSASQIQITVNFLRNLNSAQLLPEIYRVKAKRQNKTRNLYFTTIIGFPFLPYWHLNKEQKLGYSLQDISKSFGGLLKNRLRSPHPIAWVQAPVQNLYRDWEAKGGAPTWLWSTRSLSGISDGVF